MEEKHIWDSTKGITPLENDPEGLSASQISGIKAVWTDQRNRLEGSAQLSDFTERMSREWAIETGVIEDLYEIDRGVTQTLIERGFQAELLSHGTANKPREYVIQLLHDQKDALDGVFDFVRGDRTLSTSYIKELHAALLRSQNSTEGLDAQGHYVEIPLIKGAWKNQTNYPVRDGITYTYCPPEHVDSEMARLIAIHEDHVSQSVPSEVQAAWLHHRFSQIHPFQDGNGRVARAIASLLLIKDGLFPLVVTRDDRRTYLDALEAADDGILKPLIDLITKLQISQFRKASAISDIVLIEEDVQAALGNLLKAADKLEADHLEALNGVFDHATHLENNLKDRLQAIQSSVGDALQRVSGNDGKAYITSSGPETDHYFRSQIIENAKKNIGYFADTAHYRSWVALNMRWSRRGQLVFAFHGIGKPFNGSLICSPFLEFKDTDEEGQVRAALIPVSDEGFVFFYNENNEKLLDRFNPWREGVIRIALKELAQNL